MVRSGPVPLAGDTEEEGAIMALGILPGQRGVQITH